MLVHKRECFSREKEDFSGQERVSRITEEMSLRRLKRGGRNLYTSGQLGSGSTVYL